MNCKIGDIVLDTHYPDRKDIGLIVKFSADGAPVMQLINSDDKRIFYIEPDHERWKIIKSK